MLRDIVHLIRKAASHELTDGTLFCRGLLLDDQAVKGIPFLEEKEVIENTDYVTTEGATINLELSIARLNALGYYKNADSLVVKNLCTYPESLYYVDELGHFSDEANDFYHRYKTLIGFIDAIKSVATLHYEDVDREFALISRDDKALLLPFLYSAGNVRQLSAEDTVNLQLIAEVFSDTGTEKQLLFINEMIDFLSPASEVVRFTTLLRNVSEFTDKCNNAYQYYLRDFSYNKLKIELDSKALEFTQKIQAVINDSQNKLVTIPTAFVLVFATFEFKDPNSVKNIVAIVSLFIFAVLIQIFLNNQFSSLNFTAANIDSYKDTFSQTNLEKFKEAFGLVDGELTKQRNRLTLVAWLLWLIPVALALMWLFLPTPPAAVPPVH